MRRRFSSTRSLDLKDMLRKNQISTEASSISQKLEVAMEEAEEINRLEKLFGWPVTKFRRSTSSSPSLSHS